jgi:hypothetical protein
MPGRGKKTLLARLSPALQRPEQMEQTPLSASKATVQQGEQTFFGPRPEQLILQKKAAVGIGLAGQAGTKSL